ncbi:ankyrin repeat protein [Histomonas meleagridis]|uniref:ankyrin repeat protein n=1 Tax=Histomonas meleagridis TaxID=135588 RepID=UPI0035598E79|nr:ankyrin repeat protein [Histomonas meleagridis]KAH0801284.1 ankyrin repeat protein [Histomonas meleagridis]
MFSPFEMFLCFKEDKVSYLEQQLSNGLSVDARFPRDCKIGHKILNNQPTLLNVAVYCRAEKCMRLLIGQGADIEATDSAGIQLSHFAIAGGSVKIANFLDNIGVKFNNSIQIAVENGNFEAFFWLYNNKSIRLNATYAKRNSLLHYAAKGGNPRILKFIQSETNLDINITNEYLLTPLHLAAKYGKCEVMKALLEYPNIKVNCQDNVFFAYSEFH